MPDIKNLGLRDDVVTVGDPSQIPAARPRRPDTPQPGLYTFQLPDNVSTAWERFEVQVGEDFQERVAVVFDDEHPLSIFIGEDPTPYFTRISNHGYRKVGEAIVPDLWFLLRDGLRHPVKAAMKNSEWMEALNSHAGELFRADHGLQASCNPKSDIYDAKTGKSVPGKKGCGARYYTSDFRLPEGTYTTRLTCGGRNGTCGNALRAFGQLERFYALKKAAVLGFPPNK